MTTTSLFARLGPGARRIVVLRHRPHPASVRTLLITILTVTHQTVYRYSEPVEFGEHRLMFRPRDSHDLRLLDTSLTISPAAQIRWLHDVFGNSIALARFSEAGQELAITSSFRAKHYPLALQELTLEAYAERYPFSYSADEAVDLGRTSERHYP